MSRIPRRAPRLRAASIAAGALLVAACSPAPAPDAPAKPPTHAEYSSALLDSDLAGSLLAQRWLEAADSALAAPSTLELPHQERGVFLAHEARAVGIAFVAVEDQRLKIDLDLSEDSTGRLFAELFLLEDDAGGVHRREVATFTDLAGGVLPLPAAGRYVLRLQPELLARTDYHLRLQLAAALEFPVSRHGRGDIGGVFGDPRDGGRRRHEGIDIFAARNTPVVAVADGVAVPRSSRLGGNTVWLRGQGKSYYYAHLERPAFGSRRSVRAGEIVGYVGNSGNAATTPPHLHFGVYRRGRGAVNPLPYIADRTWQQAPPAVPGAPAAYAVVSAATLNLRTGPGVDYAALDSLPAGTPVRALASSGAWLRVWTRGQRGWIHRDYQAPSVPLGETVLRTDAWLHDRPGPGSDALARLYAGDDVRDFGGLPGWRLLGRTESPLGWAREETVAHRADGPAPGVSGAGN